MKTIYIIFILSVLYYLWFNKKRDVFTFTILSSIIYFIPNLFGYVSVKYKGIYYKYSIDNKMYIIHMIYIIVMLIFQHRNQLQNKKNKHFSSLNEKYFSITIILFTIGLFLCLAITLKSDLILYKTTKKEGIVGYIYTIYNLALPVAFILSYKLKYKKFLIILGSFLLLSIYQGYRSITIFALMSIMLDFFYDDKNNLFSTNSILLFICVFIFGFTGKTVISQLRNKATIMDIFKSVFSFSGLFDKIKNSEPFVIQYNLNTVISQNFTLSKKYLLRFPHKIFFLTSRYSKLPPHIYEQFVNEFVPGIDYGIAYNIFYELYAIFGLIGVIIVSVIFGMILSFIHDLTKNESKVLQSFGLVTSIFFGFYLFRNSIENMIFYLQFFTVLFAVGFIGQYFFCFLKRKFFKHFKLEDKTGINKP